MKTCGPRNRCLWEKCQFTTSSQFGKYCKKHLQYIRNGVPINFISQYAKTQEERFWEKVDKSGICWEWLGGKSRGYGTFRFLSPGGKSMTVGAHRVSYFWLTGQFGEEFGHIDHLCRNPSCVNPEHLEMVTPGENALRGIGPTAVNSKKTHCIYGHELSGPNLINRSDGGRSCRVCRRKTAREWARKKAAKNALSWL